MKDDVVLGDFIFHLSSLIFSLYGFSGSNVRIVFHPIATKITPATASTPKMDPRGARLHAEAKRLLTCRYTMVEVVVGPPQKGRQHKSRVEPRRLTESEGWDALNETWGVFVGWAIWNRLETTDRLGRRWDWDAIEGFLDRLDEAYQNGDISGYYVPVDVDQADAATLQQLPGVDATIADQMIAGRPYGSNQAFLTKLAALVSATDAQQAAAYLTGS